MANDQPEYQANDAGEIVGELFSGKLPMAEALERLRTRLLDLSSRNRLLNYRHPKNRCVQVVDSLAHRTTGVKQWCADCC